MNIITILYMCGVIGILDTSYLIYHKMMGTDVACLFFPPEWCKKVQYSSYSRTFGIPNSMLGFAMYVIIILLGYLFRAALIPFWPITFIITFGFVFSLYFTYIQAFVLRAFCTWCVVSALNFLVMFIAVWRR